MSISARPVLYQLPGSQRPSVPDASVWFPQALFSLLLGGGVALGALSALSVAGAKALEVSAVAGEKHLKLFPPPEFSSKTPGYLRILLSSLACKML